MGWQWKGALFLNCRWNFFDNGNLKHQRFFKDGRANGK